VYVFRPEIGKGIDSKKMNMRGVDERPLRAEIRNDHLDYSAGSGDPLEFLRNPDDVIEMLYNIVRINLIKAGIRKRVGKYIQIVNNIGIGC